MYRRTGNRLKMLSRLGQTKDSERKQKDRTQTWDLTNNVVVIVENTAKEGL